MKAIKKRVQRKYAIPGVDTLVITPKDETQRLAKALEDVIITEDDGSQNSSAPREAPAGIRARPPQRAVY